MYKVQPSSEKVVGRQAMNSSELIGLVASFLAALSFGSYGVPMKGEASTRVDVDPLVFQSYKAVTVFVSLSYIEQWLSLTC